MKKSTVRITVIILILIVGVVGYYAYLSQKSRNASAEAAETEVQRVLSRDLQKDYPPTPKEVVKYFTQIQKCMYNDNCTAEEIQDLGMKARELYDAELMEINAVEDYIPRLRTEIESFHKDEKSIVSISLPSSINIDTFTEDNFDFARLYCRYSVIEKGTSSQMQIVYLLRRDGNRQWKIYGWEKVDNAVMPDIAGDGEE